MKHPFLPLCKVIREGYLVLTVILCNFYREAAKPPPQPTHKVAVHIPSQKNFDSDSEIEEVRRRVICLLWKPTCVLFSFMDNLLSFSFYLHLSCVPIQLTEVKTIPTPAPRGEKVSSATHVTRYVTLRPKNSKWGKGGRRRVTWRVETFYFTLACEQALLFGRMKRLSFHLVDFVWFPGCCLMF